MRRFSDHWARLVGLVPRGRLALRPKGGVTDLRWSPAAFTVLVAALVAALVSTGAAIFGPGTVGWAHVLLPTSLLASIWLLRQVRSATAEARRSARHERHLLAASEQMATARTRREADQVIVTAVVDLLDDSDARSMLWEEQDRGWVAVATAGGSRLATALEVRLPERLVAQAAAGRPWVLGDAEAAEVAEHVGLDAENGAFVFVPLPRPDGPRAVLGLGCTRRPDAGLLNALRRFAQELGAAEDRTRLVDEAAELRARLAAVLDGSTDVIAQLDADGRFVLLNRAVTAVLGYQPEELIGTSMFDLIAEEDRARVLRTTIDGDLTAGVDLTHRLYDAGGAVREVESRISQPDADSGYYVFIARDVTERNALEAELVYHADHDALTGLANRSSLIDRLEQALVRARRHGVPVGLLMLDLDDFTSVNDRHGHEVGDRVLVEVARRLHDAVRSTDVAARLDGDEFAVIVEAPGDPEEVLALAGRLRTAVAEPILLADGGRVQVTASLGIATSPTDSDADGLLRTAHEQLCAGKQVRHPEPERPEAHRPAATRAAV